MMDLFTCRELQWEWVWTMILDIVVGCRRRPGHNYVSFQIPSVFSGKSACTVTTAYVSVTVHRCECVMRVCVHTAYAFMQRDLRWWHSCDITEGIKKSQQFVSGEHLSLRWKMEGLLSIRETSKVKSRWNTNASITSKVEDPTSRTSWSPRMSFQFFWLQNCLNESPSGWSE